MAAPVQASPKTPFSWQQTGRFGEQRVETDTDADAAEGSIGHDGSGPAVIERHFEHRDVQLSPGAGEALQAGGDIDADLLGHGSEGFDGGAVEALGGVPGEWEGLAEPRGVVRFRVVGEEPGEGELGEQDEMSAGGGGAAGLVDDVFQVPRGGAGVAVDAGRGDVEAIEQGCVLPEVRIATGASCRGGSGVAGIALLEIELDAPGHIVGDTGHGVPAIGVGVGLGDGRQIEAAAPAAHTRLVVLKAERPDGLHMGGAKDADVLHPVLFEVGVECLQGL